METKDIIRNSFAELLAVQFRRLQLEGVVNLEEAVNDLMACIEVTEKDDKVEVRPAPRPFALVLEPRHEATFRDSVAGCWDVCAVRGGERRVVTFSTKVSKVLYVFFMLHPGEKFSFAQMQHCHEEFRRIALALYTDPRMPSHTRKTLEWADDVARRLSSLYAVGQDHGNNEHRSVAFSKAKRAVYDALGIEAGDYVIQGRTADEKRVLRLAPGQVCVPASFREEVIDWQGGFAV